MSGEMWHKGQTQVVEGSPSGDYYTTTKLDYAGTINLVYLGECKIGISDSINSHFIQQFLYINNLLTSIQIATNETTLGCTNINISVPTSQVVQITLNNGDVSEININDGFSFNSGPYNFAGTVQNVIQPNILWINVLNGTSGISPVSNFTIGLTDMLCNLEADSTKKYEKRRFDHRTRYLYK